ncbi:MAG: ECF-type sigma factor, partial [Planctomycetia bacterium]
MSQSTDSSNPDMGTTTGNIHGWLQKLKLGLPESRNALLEHSQKRLRHMVRRQFWQQQDLRRLEETDDILQKALIRLNKAMETIQPDTVAEFFGLASQQIRWVLLDLGQEMGKLRENESIEFRMFSDKFLFDLPKADSTSPGSLLEWEHFHKTIQSLTELEKSLFDLVYYQGLTQDE